MSAEPDHAKVNDVVGKGQCKSHDDCIRTHGEHFICRSAQRACVSLVSRECSFLSGDDSDDDAVFVGVLSPEENAPRFFGTAELVREDFSGAVGGLPLAGQADPRSFVVVGCTYPYGGDPLPAARYLIETIGVPVVIGPATSPDAIAVAQNVALPAGALLMLPSAQSELLSDLDDGDLLFRTTATTAAVAPLIAAVLSDLEPRIRTERAVTEIKVAIVSRRDGYGISLSEATSSELRFNGALDVTDNEARGHFLSASYDPTAEIFEGELAERIIAFAPDVVISLSAFDPRPLRAIEEAWPAQHSAPYYVMDGGGGAPPYRAFVASRPDSLRQRMRIIANLDPQRPLYQRYAQRIETEFGPMSPLLDAPYGYDAAYAVAYGIIGAPSRPLTGRTIARGIRRLVGPGAGVAFFPEQINEAVALLRSGQTINIDGVTGPLDFDLHGDVVADGSVDCFVRDAATGEVFPTFAGLVFRTATGVLEGSYRCE